MHKDQKQHSLIHHQTDHGAQRLICSSEPSPLLWRNASKLRPGAALWGTELSGMLDGPAEPGRLVRASAEGGGMCSMVWLWAGAARSAGISPAGGAALEAAGRLPGAMVPGTDGEVPFICRHATKLLQLQECKHAIPCPCILQHRENTPHAMCIPRQEKFLGQERRAGGSAPGTACSARASWARACASQRPHGP